MDLLDKGECGSITPKDRFSKQLSLDDGSIPAVIFESATNLEEDN